ncbi:MAG: ABC transporter permease [Gemmatimonadetes bacterium]|nr:ABC transporter permease [Gemmatimonadota bacterium]
MHRRYRLLLLVYPREFRTTFGRDFCQFLARQRSEPRYRSVFIGATRFWWDVLADAVRSGMRLRARNMAGAWRRRRHPPQHPGRREGKLIISSVLQDVQYGMRSMVRTPTFTLIAIATLGIGIGANTAIFSVVNGVILRPLPFSNSHELVMVWRLNDRGERSVVSWPDFADWRAAARSFAGLGGFIEATRVFENDGGADELKGTSVTANMFSILDVMPALGRPFVEEEDRYGGPRAIVLSHGLWTTRFGADSTLVGRSIRADGEAHTVVGVMPRGFAFPDPTTRFWTPLREDEILRRIGVTSSGRGLSFINVLGRLDAGVAVAEAELEMTAVAAGIDAAVGRSDSTRVSVQPRHAYIVGDVTPLLYTFFGAVGLVLIIACANVANLALARAAGRNRELALRAALGAGRLRIVRQLLTENVLLAACGGLVGLALAFGLTRGLLALGSESLPRHAEVSLDGTVLIFTALVALSSGIVFGLVPALQGGRPDLLASLKDGGHGTGLSVRGQRIQRSLVVAQVMLAVVLLMGAGLLINSFWRLTSVDTGFEPQHVLTARVSLPETRYGDDEVVLGFFDRLIPALEALPGVTRVTTSYSPPFQGSEFSQMFEIEGQDEVPADELPWGRTIIVGPGYFETMGGTLVQGRDLESSDRKTAPPVAIVNETMARRYWPGEDAVGKRFRTPAGISGSVESLEPRHFERDWITVVGVAADVRRSSLAERESPEFYRPHAQMTWPGTGLLLRTVGDPMELAAALRREVWAIDPALPVTSVSTMTDLVAASVLEPRFRTLLLGIFAGMASLLAMVGVYGVMAYTVAQQTREIGIRIALGAPGAAVLRHTLARGLRLTATGVLLGSAGAFAATRLLTDMLFGVSPTDPATYLGVVLLLVGVAALASFMPARKASRIDPVAALRSE